MANEDIKLDSQTTRRRPIMFVVSTIQQARIFLGVSNALRKRGDCKLITVSIEPIYKGTDTVGGYLRDKGIFSERMYCPIGALSYVSVARRWTEGWRSLSHLITSFLVKTRPCIVVLGNDVNPVEGMLVRLSKRLGILTVLVQDGIISSAAHKFGVRAPRHIGKIRRELRGRLYQVAYILGPMGRSMKYGKGGCTRIAASGPFYRRELTKTGIAPERIVVTGQPRYDHVVKAALAAEDHRKDLREQSETQRKSVLFADYLWAEFTGDDRDDALLISALKNLSRSDPKLFRIVIKPHPLESANAYLRYIKPETGILSIGDPASDIHDYIMRSDVVITRGSTVKIDAMIWQKPVILFGCKHLPNAQRFIDSGAALNVEDGQELITVVNSVLFDRHVKHRLASAQQQLLFDLIYKLDGRASERVATLIESLM